MRVQDTATFPPSTAKLIPTASLSVDFMKPTPQDVPLKAVGTVHEIHPKKFRVETEVYADEELCAKGEVIAVVMPASFGG